MEYPKFQDGKSRKILGRDYEKTTVIDSKKPNTGN
jgi:hypothetical protein